SRARPGEHGSLPDRGGDLSGSPAATATSPPLGPGPLSRRRTEPLHGGGGLSRRSPLQVALPARRGIGHPPSPLAAGVGVSWHGLVRRDLCRTAGGTGL